MDKIINKTMDRSDLLTDEAIPIVRSINDLIEDLYAKKLYMTSWYGCLPKSNRGAASGNAIRPLMEKMLGRKDAQTVIGLENRGPAYEPIPNSADDARIPWYLYWEIFWVIQNGPQVKSNMRLLDAGGTSSLFSCYLASLGSEVHSIDRNQTLISNGKQIAKTMGWNMFSYAMGIENMHFPNEYFDHAYSICVFEHLDFKIKQAALSKIARCLKPNGVLSITFDYRNPAPAVVGFGPDDSKRNQLKTVGDLERTFLSTEYFELFGNQEFYDNTQSYLVHPEYDNAPYTFGAIFLKKRS